MDLQMALSDDPNALLAMVAKLTAEVAEKDVQIAQIQDERAKLKAEIVEIRDAHDAAEDEIKRLTEITPKEYFARLWELALEGRKPTMKIEAQGTDTAYMVLGLDDRRERIRLVIEGGRWVWTPPASAKLGGEER